MIKKLLENKVVKNFSYLTTGSAISQLLLLITIIKITNAFSPDEYGLYTFILAQSILLHSISDLGIRAIIIRAIARNPEKTNDIVLNGIKLRVATLLVLLILYLIYNYFLGQLNPVHITLLGLYALLDSFFHIFEYVFLGNQKMLYPSVVKVIHSFIWFSIIILLPEEYFEVNLLLGIFIFLNLIQVLVFFSLLKRNGFLIGKVGNFWASSRSLILEGWPYFCLMILTIPTNHLANNFLDINSTTDEVGYFNLARKLMSPVSLIITFALTALFPNLAIMFELNKTKFSKMISEGTRLFIGILAFFSFFFTMFSKEAVNMFFADSYNPAIKVIQLQIWYISLNGINHLITVIYGAVNMEKKIFKLAIVGALISTPMLYAGSYFGALGISTGFVVSFALYEIYFWQQFIQNIKIPIKNGSLIWIVTIFLFLLSYFLPESTAIYIKISLTFLVLGLYFLYFKNDIYKLSSRSGQVR